MFAKWMRFLLWQPFALMCRRFPLWPFRATLTHPVDGVVCIRIDNLLTRLLSRLSGGYDYAVCYLIDGSLVVDTGFPWARRRLKKALIELGAGVPGVERSEPPALHVALPNFGLIANRHPANVFAGRVIRCIPRELTVHTLPGEFPVQPPRRVERPSASRATPANLMKPR